MKNEFFRINTLATKEYELPDYKLDKVEVNGNSIKISVPIGLEIKNGLYGRVPEIKYMNLIFGNKGALTKYINRAIKYRDSLEKITIGALAKMEYLGNERKPKCTLVRWDNIHLNTKTEIGNIELSFTYKADLSYFIDQLNIVKENLNI